MAGGPGDQMAAATGRHGRLRVHGVGHVKIRLHRARVRLRKAMHAACDFTQDQRGTMVCHPKIPCG